VTAKICIAPFASVSTGPTRRPKIAASWCSDTAWKWLARRRPAQWSEKPVESKGAGADEQTADDIEVTRSVLAALESRKAG
jgi:hypothetical protein